MSVLIAASSLRTCFGDGESTFKSLLEGKCGVGNLRYVNAAKVNVAFGYHIEEEQESLFRASRWLTECIREVFSRCEVDPREQRVLAIVGTGLRELRSIERCASEWLDFPAELLHFSHAVQQACPQLDQIITISNACSAGGHAVALAQDLLELNEADVVLVAGTDAMTASMLAMIGRFRESPAGQVRPFDSDRDGVLLGEGAAALVLIPDGSGRQALARLLGTGLSCDAFHETVPHQDGIRRAMLDAFERAGRTPAQVDVVVAHGTGTALNDPVEAGLLREVFASDGPGPWITALKGAIGHTSGGAALMSLDVALRCLKTGLVPPIVGLREPLKEGRGLRFVTGRPVRAPVRLAHVNAFGFGGVNSATLVENLSCDLGAIQTK